MASFPNGDHLVCCPASAERTLLLVNVFTCAALSNAAAVDAAVVAHPELATLQRNGLTSTSSRNTGVRA